jgi:outer membrane immunogenic protein
MDEPPVAYDWSGAYVGIQGGWQWIRDDVEDPVSIFQTSFDFDAPMAGIHAGMDFQSGSWVLGLAGDAEWANGDGESGLFGDMLEARAEVNWQASLRARLGYAFDRTLIYATGGLALAGYDLDYTGRHLPFGPDEFSDTLLGYTVGVGAAYAFADQWNVWADYRYTEFGTASGDIINCCSNPPNSQDHDISTKGLRIGLSRRF